MNLPVKVPQLCAARHAVTVAVPRFRRKQSSVVTLTEAVHRVIGRVLNTGINVAVFVVDGRPCLSDPATREFARLQRLYPDCLIGTYGPGLKVADLVSDLQEYFSDGDA